MLQPTCLQAQSSQLSETEESSSLSDSGGPFQHLEFIAEEVHVNDPNQSRRETHMSAQLIIHC